MLKTALLICASMTLVACSGSIEQETKIIPANFKTPCVVPSEYKGGTIWDLEVYTLRVMADYKECRLRHKKLSEI